MNVKRKQEITLEHIKNILTAYESNEIDDTIVEGETLEDTVLRLVKQQIEYYLTRR